MKIILTKHVKERRKQGFIKEIYLNKVCKYLIEKYIKEKEDGLFKIYQKETVAIINKKEREYVFITFYGRTNWIQKTIEYGEWQIEKTYKKEKCIEIKKKKEEDLKRLSKENKEKLKKNFYIEKIEEGKYKDKYIIK